MANEWRRVALLGGLVVLILAAGCATRRGRSSSSGGPAPALDSAAGTTTSNTTPASSLGTGSTLTTVPCTDAATDCGYWYCRCEDGALVNASFCTEGYCATDSAACQFACQELGHGNWSSTAGGGPTGGSSSSGTSTSNGGETSSGQPPGNDPTSCGLFESGGSLCADCVVFDCCAEAAVCGVGTECLDYQTCFANCAGDTFCEADCESAFPAGSVEWQDLLGCVTAFCSAECGAP